jgi:hypothetical protein
MANTALSLSINRGTIQVWSSSASPATGLVVGTSAPGVGDFEIRIGTADPNAKGTRLAAAIACDVFKNALLSGGIITTDLEG